MRVRTHLAALSALTALALGAPAAAQQFQQDDLVIGVNSAGDDGFRQVRNNVGDLTPATPGDSGTLITGGAAGVSPWIAPFIQSVEFDNADGSRKNAAGNLIGANSGFGFNGFEISNFATDGTGASQSLWNILAVTGGTPGTDPGASGPRAEVGGGVSVSPNNSRIAWANSSNGQLQVMEYDAGSSIGSGSGAAITGWIESDLGNGAGGSGVLTPLATGETQATTWLNDDTVLGISAFGEVISWDVSGLTSSDPTTPTTDSGWTIAASGLFGSGDFLDILYEPTVDADHIVISRGVFAGGTSTSEIYVLDSTTFAVVDQIDISGSSQTAREIAYDSDGNLFIGGFGEDLADVIPDFAASIGSLTDNSSIDWFNNDFFSSFTGLDVALTDTGGPGNLLGDADGDGDVDGDDLIAVQTEFGSTGSVPLLGDADFDGDVDGDDLIAVQTEFGNTLAVAVPEPTTAGLLVGLLGAGFLARRRS